MNSYWWPVRVRKTFVAHLTKAGGFHALANPIAFTDRCGTAWRNPDRICAIADQLSMVRQVLRQLDVRGDLLLLYELSTMYDHLVWHRGGLHPKPLLPWGAAGAPAQPSARVTTACCRHEKITPRVTPILCPLPGPSQLDGGPRALTEVHRSRAGQGAASIRTQIKT